MAEYRMMNNEELSAEKAQLEKLYKDFKDQGLKLDMSRGKPGADQLDLTNEMLDTLSSDAVMKGADGVDCRNYGILDGIAECKELFAEIMEVDVKNVIVGGNSSLNMMFDFVAQCMTHGAGSTPWAKLDKVKFLCPVPGYDRHFTICEYFGIEMVNVPMNSEGPDMDVLEELIKDETVKGMFCVPKYSNPQGITFSDETVKRIAALKPAAEDFRIIWDNAYCVHDINDTPDKLLNIFDECAKTDNEDMIIEVTSTSKISFPGAGVAALAASDNNIKMIKNRMSKQTIGNDKINQLRHALYFKNLDGIKAHMKRHAAIIAPKFEIVLEELANSVKPYNIASWENPNGGYFISLDVMNGCAKRVVELCKEAGVVLTGAGATYPYGKDPDDKNIRIAPTFPSVDELKTATKILCVCVKLATVEKLLENK
ncbi:MAG: aminotransferase class I/II-fold pyridoxal phosphate-dependent enzyme [Clostridia bacterium]|nr:aminotransferase class I/II-fold pyridoxal phosphate-dependent enzyme [Clostridia bacterium]